LKNVSRAEKGRSDVIAVLAKDYRRARADESELKAYLRNGLVDYKIDWA
jgi:hypothetical protein